MRIPRVTAFRVAEIMSRAFLPLRNPHFIFRSVLQRNLLSDETERKIVIVRSSKECLSTEATANFTSGWDEDTKFWIYYNAKWTQSGSAERKGSGFHFRWMLGKYFAFDVSYWHESYVVRCQHGKRQLKGLMEGSIDLQTNGGWRNFRAKGMGKGSLEASFEHSPSSRVHKLALWSSAWKHKNRITSAN
jgi:hypothetical protein